MTRPVVTIEQRVLWRSDAEHADGLHLDITVNPRILLQLLDAFDAAEERIAELETEIAALQFDLDNAHDGRNKEAIARCEAEDRIVELETRLEEMLWASIKDED